MNSKGQYIVSGSDDGSFFIWEKETTNLVRILQGDESIVNCLQPHPSYCFLATSGIDPVVRLWNPRPEVKHLTVCFKFPAKHRSDFTQFYQIIHLSMHIGIVCLPHATWHHRRTLKMAEWWRTWTVLLKPISDV